MIVDEALTPELRRLDALIGRDLRRMRARYALSTDEFHGLYVTDERVDALLRETSLESDPDTGPEPFPAARAFRAAAGPTRWTQLAASLGLTDDDRDILLLCLAPELDVKYETLYAYLNDDVNRRWPTIELAERLFGRSPKHRGLVRAAMLPGSPLLSSCAIEFVSTPRDLPRSRRALRAAPPLRDWLMGLVYSDDRLVGPTRFFPPGSPLPQGAVPAALGSSLSGLANALAEGIVLPPIVVTAAAAPEACLFAQDLFSRARRAAIVVELAALRSMTAPDDLVNALELAQRVLGVGIVASSLDALCDQDGRLVDSVTPALRRLVRGSPSLILATGPNVRGIDTIVGARTIEVQVPELQAAERAAAWRWAVAHPDGGNGCPVEHSTIIALADRFVLGAESILRAAAAAVQQAALAGLAGPAESHLFAASRAVSITDSAGTTRHIATMFDWDDLVLPFDVKQRVADVVHAISLRGRVLDEWGFARRIGGGRGARILLAGPSGTGKSTAAAIIGKTLQLEIHRIELATVVSKFIGETEKNLDRAFSAARQANAILFIDEADALLGKRSQVKDAHDRYANVEVAYLLQKMEDHDGIVIVATNLAQNIDEAFSRRIQYSIEFPFPDTDGRERLWRGMLPAGAPLAADIDFGFLARQFELSGGDIRNIVLDAAYRAAQSDSEITMTHLLCAIARQYGKTGRVPTLAEFREHYAVLQDEHPRSMAVAVPEVGQ